MLPCKWNKICILVKLQRNETNQNEIQFYYFIFLFATLLQVVEKGLVIQEKEKLYNELKGILARQPGPEVAEQLTVYQQNLKQKTRQMKAMASELNMYQGVSKPIKYCPKRKCIYWKY